MSQRGEVNILGCWASPLKGADLDPRSSKPHHWTTPLEDFGYSPKVNWYTPAENWAVLHCRPRSLEWPGLASPGVEWVGVPLPR